MTEENMISEIRKYLNLPDLDGKKDDTARQMSRSIAQYLGPQWMTWVEQPLGSVQFGNSHRVDVFAMSKSYKFVTRIYEIKISRSDFQKDLFEGKFKSYLSFCNYFYFATPSGLVKKDEIPKGCGLISFGGNGWKAVKGPVHRDVKYDPEFMLALLMKGYQDNYERYRDLENKRYSKTWEYKGLADASYEFGLKLSYDITHSKEYVDRANKLKEQIEAVANQKFNDIGFAYQWLDREVENLLDKRKYGKEAAEILEVAIQLYKGNTWNTRERLKGIIDRLDPNP